MSYAFQAGASVEAVAAYHCLSSQHLRRRITAYTGVKASVEIERMRVIGRLAIRLTQFNIAISGNGNVQMLIWLGKQRLGQSDKARPSCAGSSALVMTRYKMTAVEWEATYGQPDA